MGQHLQLYASHHIPLEDARLWCQLAIIDHAHTPREEEVIRNVESAMSATRRHLPDDHLEHWARSAGGACWPFLNLGAHLCDQQLVEIARHAGSIYRHHQQRANPDSHYAQHDWENDQVIEFLSSHIAPERPFTVWGFVS
jgi:hypothetical protein